MTADDEEQWKIKSGTFFSIFCSPLHTSGTVLIIIISSTLPLCLRASFEQCFLFCAFLQQAPAFLETAAWALSQDAGMPASASIHFCFHYASFLWSFKLILMLPSISRPIKRPRFCLPWWAGTCSGIQRMELWRCWGYPFPPPASSWFLAEDGGTHPAPCSAGSGDPSRAGPEPRAHCWPWISHLCSSTDLGAGRGEGGEDNLVPLKAVPVAC